MLPESDHLSCYFPGEFFTRPDSTLLQFVSCPHAQPSRKSNQVFVRNHWSYLPDHQDPLICSLTNHRRPIGSEVVHSHYTPTRFLKILKLLCELWRPHLHPSSVIGFLKMDIIHVYLWFRDVDPLCIAHGYTSYSYMTWICSVFDWNPWFISSWAWVCPPWRDNYYFCKWHLPNSSPRLTQFIRWLIFVMYFGHHMLL